MLTDDNITDIACIPCANHVKYLGVPVHLDHKKQRDKCVASVKRNLGHLKWKLRKVDLDIKETLTCVLARSILVYTGTPMVAAGLWKKEDIDHLEAQLFRDPERSLQHEERLGNHSGTCSEGQHAGQEAAANSGS